jgi:hypothetical protein
MGAKNIYIQFSLRIRIIRRHIRILLVRRRDYFLFMLQVPVFLTRNGMNQKSKYNALIVYSPLNEPSSFIMPVYLILGPGLDLSIMTLSLL